MPMRRYTRRTTRRSYAVRARGRRAGMLTRKRMYRPKLYRSVGILSKCLLN